VFHVINGAAKEVCGESMSKDKEMEFGGEGTPEGQEGGRAERHLLREPTWTVGTKSAGHGIVDL
jgi:hypothetical protein